MKSLHLNQLPTPSRRVERGWMIGHESLAAVALDGVEHGFNVSHGQRSKLGHGFESGVFGGLNARRPWRGDGRTIECNEADGCIEFAMDNGNHGKIEIAASCVKLTVNGIARHGAGDAFGHVLNLAALPAEKRMAVPVCAASVQLLGKPPAGKVNPIPCPAMHQCVFHGGIKHQADYIVNN